MKPTDSAGSKGCSRVDSENELQKALDYAMEHSIGKHIIVEEFIEKEAVLLIRIAMPKMAS